MKKAIAQAAALSARETEVLSLALRGRTNERIAQELFIAKSTADTHLRRIYSKCGVHSRQELLDLAEKTAASLAIARIGAAHGSTRKNERERPGDALDGA